MPWHGVAGAAAPATLAAMTARAIDSVIFDFGGVLAANGRPSDFNALVPPEHRERLGHIMTGVPGTDGDHPWHRVERGEITLAEARAGHRALLAEAGIELQLPEAGAAPRIVFRPNEPVVALVHELKAAGFRLGVLTNNVLEFRENWRAMLPFDDLFDDIVDSHEVKMRKPNPAIYQLALARLGAEAGRTAFLDDVAANVEAAERVGMRGVVVDEDPTLAVATVRRLAGLTD